MLSTVTVTVSVHPFGVVAVIVVVPSATPVTTPVCAFTVATDVSLLDQVTVLFVLIGIS